MTAKKNKSSRLFLDGKDFDYLKLAKNHRNDRYRTELGTPDNKRSQTTTADNYTKFQKYCNKIKAANVFLNVTQIAQVEQSDQKDYSESKIQFELPLSELYNMKVSK